MDESSQPGDHNAGALYAALAYCLWGLMPLYWRLLGDVPPFELTVHRVLWSTIFVAGVTIARGRSAHIRAIVRTPRLLWTLALTGVLIGCNWALYIY